ncbi:hypothetical protein PoB_006126700 [Plakobranchus ocellatus]|uniref:Uncharacterized protein n=1 Tax=Plakobranchus ocellatus TaxID=259542 RepID=A0AAV4CS90_9GAST|nr:hypothetical protein PoB_006126700 [Plakobranchus ocellatus]
MCHFSLSLALDQSFDFSNKTAVADTNGNNGENRNGIAAAAAVYDDDHDTFKTSVLATDISQQTTTTTTKPQREKKRFKEIENIMRIWEMVIDKDMSYIMAGTDRRRCSSYKPIESETGTLGILIQKVRTHSHCKLSSGIVSMNLSPTSQALALLLSVAAMGRVLTTIPTNNAQCETCLDLDWKKQSG